MPSCPSELAWTFWSMFLRFEWRCALVSIASAMRSRPPLGTHHHIGGASGYGRIVRDALRQVHRGDRLIAIFAGREYGAQEFDEVPRQASTNPEHWSATEDYMMNIVKYRTREPGLRPRRTKLEIPGWAGGREPRADGSHEYVWHCLPFSEGAQYGIELFYPYENELHVTTRDSKLIFDGDFGPPPENGLQWPPFRTFGEKFYTYQILLDLRVGEGLAIRTEPHPRFYAD